MSTSFRPPLSVFGCFVKPWNDDPQEVSLDGMTVLRMPGSKPWSRLPPRDPSFELGVTDEGLEVTRGEDVVWEGKKNFV